MDSYTLLSKINQYKYLILALIIVIFGVIFLSQYSFINISVENSSGNDVTYTLIKSGAEKPAVAAQTKDNYKKLVRRGTYEVSVRQDDGSYFAVIKTGGFLTTTKVNAKLSPQVKREFVGNNPSPCFDVVDGILLSYLCGGSRNNLYAHIPATNQLPTYTKNDQNGFTENVENISMIGNKHYLLVRNLDLVGSTPSHVAYKLDSAGDALTLQEDKATPLSGLQKNTDYQVTAYKDGFIAYPQNLNEIIYYASLDAQPKSIKPTLDIPENLEPGALNARDDTILLSYTSDVSDHINHSGDESKPPAGNTTIYIINDEGLISTLEFKSILYTPALCGNQKLCAINGKTFEVYDITGNKPKLLYQVSSVSAFKVASDDKVILVHDNSILEFNVEFMQGFIVYDMGDYEYCGTDINKKNVVLCLINNQNSKVALLLSLDLPNDDDIDKKVAELTKQGYQVSIYKKFIYVTPNLGETTYIPEINGFGYPQSVRETANNSLQQVINNIGFDRNKYTIINVYQP